MFRYLKWDPLSEALHATDKVIGRHRLEEVPRTIAWWNDLPKSELYTIHSFRRTAASKMAENGATILEIMLAGGWKSDKIARTYVEKSMRTKVTYVSILVLFHLLFLFFCCHRSVYQICLICLAARRERSILQLLVRAQLLAVPQFHPMFVSGRTVV